MNTKRIAFCIESFSNTGGMERVLSVCANQLAKMYDITIITAFQHDKADVFALDNRIERVDLDVHAQDCRRSILRNPIVDAYKNELADYLCHHSFDFVISMGGLDLRFLPEIMDGSKKILWLHFPIDIAKLWYRSEASLLNKFFAKLQTYRRIQDAKKFDKIIVLSDADRFAWAKHTQKVIKIYNPLTVRNNQIPDYSVKAVISVGRLDRQKGFDYLIDAWRLVYQKHPDWVLDIYGDGPLKVELGNQIHRNGLDRVIKLKGVHRNMPSEYIKHSIYVMSSRNEGFPLVLLESLACGLPIVSFNCPQGPSEIINHGKNGYLVDEVGDIFGLSRALCKVIEDIELRKQMGHQALMDAEKYSVDKIMNQWIQMFESLS